MSEAVEDYEHAGLRIKIYQDEHCESPREWDNLGTMVCWHRDYTLGDKHEYADPESFRDQLPKGSEILPLFLYDHSGLTMNTSGFSCPWDSGQVGYIFVTAERIKKEYGKLSEATRKTARRVLVAEVETFDKYLRGDVYGYQIEDPDGEHLDSCWGFFGLKECEEEAESAAEWHAADIIKKRCARTKALVKNRVPLDYRGAAK